MSTGFRSRNVEHTLIVLLQRFGPLSRSQLAREAQLSRSTVSGAISEMIARGLVVEGEHVRSEGRGRPSLLVALAPSAGTAIGIDFGFRHVRGVIADLSHRMLAKSEVALTIDYAVDVGLDAAASIVDELLGTSWHATRSCAGARRRRPLSDRPDGYGDPLGHDPELEWRAYSGDVGRTVRHAGACREREPDGRLGRGRVGRGARRPEFRLSEDPLRRRWCRLCQWKLRGRRQRRRRRDRPCQPRSVWPNLPLRQSWLSGDLCRHPRRPAAAHPHSSRHHAWQTCSLSIAEATPRWCGSCRKRHRRSARRLACCAMRSIRN